MTEDEVIFKSWFQAQLSDLLGFPTGEEMINYILTFESAREIKEHFNGLLDPTDHNTKVFIEQFFSKWRPTTANAQLYKKVESSVGNKKTNNNKARNSSLSIFADERRENGGKTDKSYRVPMKEERSSQPMMASLFPEHNNSADHEDEPRERKPHPPSNTLVDIQSTEFLDENQVTLREEQPGSPFKEKALKYVPLYSDDGEVNVAAVEGRHPCKCLAQKHKLINNCQQCGRIVCQQEGAGPCLFCGNLVCTTEDMQILERDSKKSKKLHEKLMSQTYEEENGSLEKAIAHKDAPGV